MCSTANKSLKTTENVSSGGNLQDKKLSFIPPPEAPIFYPSEEEFQDPLTYIAKIRVIAENMGICRIKPPSQWQPPFAVDVDKLKFTPRIQKLNELDAKTRIKLNFLDKIAKFWELQGMDLKIPFVAERALDLYTLYETVHAEGDFTGVTVLKKWPIICRKMNYPVEKNIAMTLKSHYERLLRPFDLFNEQRKISNENRRTVQKCKPQRSVLNMDIKPRALKDGINFEFFENDERKAKSQARKKICYDSETFDPLAKYVCWICNKGDGEEYMLLCDECDDGYHMFCLMPPLNSIPEGDWCCPKCVAEECSKPMDAC